MTTLHDRLREAREKAGLYQYQLATALKVRPSAVSHWESGRRTPRDQTIERIAELTFSNPDHLRGRVPFVPLPTVRPIRVAIPRGSRKNKLTREERELLLFWRGLTDRQRQNFLKLIQVSLAVSSKSQSER